MNMELISREEAKVEIRKAFPTLADRVDINSIINGLPSVKAIPLDRVEQIRAEIEQEYNKYRNMSDKWDERACGLGRSLEIIDKALKKLNE